MCSFLPIYKTGYDAEMLQWGQQPSWKDELLTTVILLSQWLNSFIAYALAWAGTKSGGLHRPPLYLSSNPHLSMQDTKKTVPTLYWGAVSIFQCNVVWWRTPKGSGSKDTSPGEASGADPGHAGRVRSPSFHGMLMTEAMEREVCCHHNPHQEKQRENGWMDGSSLLHFLCKTGSTGRKVVI